LEKDIRRRSLMLLWNGEDASSAHVPITTVVLVLTPTGAVTFICCVSTDPGLTLGFDIGSICSCCDFKNKEA
jgi:hypothetical protein